MVKIEWGTKKTCPACGSRFYNLRKMQTTCPECGAACDFSVSVSRRRGRSAAADLTKTAVLAGDDVLVDDIDLGGEIDGAFGDDADLLEDADELGEELDGLPDVDTEEGDR